jgi:hypothetical protein
LVNWLIGELDFGIGNLFLNLSGTGLGFGNWCLERIAIGPDRVTFSAIRYAVIWSIVEMGKR